MSRSRPHRPTPPPDAPLQEALPAATDAVERLLRAGAEPPAAIDAALGLLALRVAEARGLLPAGRLERSDDTALAAELAELPSAGAFPNGLPLAAALDPLAALPRHLLTPDLPGELYPHCLEIRAGAEGAAREARRRQGVFFTPAGLVETMLDYAWPDGTPPAAFSMLEPACGGGAFLQGAARRLRRTRPEEDAARAARAALHGVDRDPVALRLAARGLWLRLSEPGAAFDLPAGRLVRADTLLAPETPACAWPSGTAANAAVLGLGFRDVAARGGFDLVVGNPPYDVLTNFGTHPDARATAEALRASKRFPLSTTGQINLYRCFIERALRLLRPGGTLVFVVPSGLLLDRAATAIRRALVEQHAADLFRLSGEKARAFPGVTQAVVVFRCRRDAGQAGSIRVVETDRASTVRPADLRALGRDLPCPAGSETDWALARWLVRNAPRRFDTLADGWVGEVDQTVYRRFMSNAPTGTRLARGAHCTPFRLDLSGGASAPAWLEREGFLRRKGSAARACLERTRRERVAQLGIRNLASVPRLVAARVPPEVFLGNSLNVWIPQSGVPLLFLLGLLNASLLDWRFRFTSGNNNINLCEIATLPLPTRLPDAAVRRVARAAADCEDAAAEPDAAAFLETRTRLDRAVGDLYHLPDEFRRHLAAPGRPD